MKKSNDITNNNNSNNKYSSYFGDSSNNVYYEIKHFTNSNKKALKEKEFPSNIINKKGAKIKYENFNTFGVHSEALYIPKDI